LSNHKIKRIFDHILQNFDKNPSHKQLKQDLKMTPVQAEKFRLKHGYSPKRMVNRLRMQEAVKLLVESKLTVGEIAKRLSYPSEAEFCRGFYGRYSMTPAAYRKEVRE